MSTYSITSRQELRVEVNMQKTGFGEGISSDDVELLDEHPDF